jgi:hypothetical protein
MSGLIRIRIVFLLALETEFGYIGFAIASISFSVSRALVNAN